MQASFPQAWALGALLAPLKLVDLGQFIHLETGELAAFRHRLYQTVTAVTGVSFHTVLPFFTDVMGRSQNSEICQTSTSKGPKGPLQCDKDYRSELTLLVEF